jgi:hypothetical protein
MKKPCKMCVTQPEYVHCMMLTRLGVLLWQQMSDKV